MATESGSSSRVQKTTSSDGAAGSARTTRTDTGDASSGAVTLVSMDGDGFVVEASAIKVSKLLNAMVDGSTKNATKEIPLPNMRSNVVAKVVEFCQHYQTDPMTDIPKATCSVRQDRGRPRSGVVFHVREGFGERDAVRDAAGSKLLGSFPALGALRRDCGSPDYE
ncbi:unnamed protein product [Ectocarpus sp. CCAP 1310/34]|nr:unnamed protein product [Ectocarpus sp. CCAP 1310/34]